METLAAIGAWLYWFLSWFGWLILLVLYNFLWVLWLFFWPFITVLGAVFVITLIRFFQIWRKDGLTEARKTYWTNTRFMYTSLWWAVRSLASKAWQYMLGKEAETRTAKPEVKVEIKEVEVTRWRRLPIPYQFSTWLSQITMIFTIVWVLAEMSK